MLNSVGDVFGHGNGATGGRSIQETDISAYSTYNPANYKNNQHQTDGVADNLGYYYYTGNANRIETETYTEGTFIMEDNSEVTASAENPVPMKQTYYGYTGSGNIANPYYNLIFRKSGNSGEYKSNFWVAARYVYLYPAYCFFFVRYLHSGNVGGFNLYGSSGGVSSPAYAVVPMVTLKSNIQVKGMDANGEWLLDTGTN